ncbi:MAG: DNA replication terminus site-binding protein, partial [Psychromonas sp.]
MANLALLAINITFEIGQLRKKYHRQSNRPNLQLTKISPQRGRVMDQEYYFIKNSDQLKEDLLKAVADVRQGIADFSKVLLLQDKQKQQQSVVFSLIDRADDQIEFEVERFAGESAVHETLHFIKSFELHKDSSQDTKKLAGFIQTALPVEVLNLHITRINAAKDRCKKIITSIKDLDIRKQADKRFYFVHHICGFTHFVTN